MRYLLLLTSLFLTLALHAQVEEPEHHSCHFVKQQISEIPLSEEQQQWLQASLERSDTFDILHYDISLDVTRFDDAHLIGDTRVDFRAKMDSLDYINLDLEGLDVKQVSTVQGKALNYTHNGPLLKVQLDTMLLSDEEYSVRVQYDGTPISYSFGGFYFEDGYAYNLGIGIQTSPHNLGRAWFPCFDNFVERSTYTYNVVSHNGRKCYAVGTFIREDTIGGDTIMRQFSMLQPIPTYLSHVAVSNYATVNYMHQGKYGAVPVQLVGKPSDTSNLRASFEPLGQIIDCMEQWYGPYPFERVGYNMTSRGAMEHPTAVAYPVNSIEGGNTNLGLITHELGHHWWGDLTTLSTEFDMWMKEGPASYSEHQIIECMQGEKAFIKEVQTNNITMVNTAHLADDGYHPLSPMPDEWTYGVTTYDKGAAMIHNLRGYLGDSLFKVGMQSVLTELAYQSINAYEFRDQLELSTGYDLHPFFENWIFSPGWSDFYVDDFSINEGGDSVEVIVKQGLYATDSLHRSVPITIAFYHPDEEIYTKRMLCSGNKSTQKFELPFTPTFVFANPKQKINLASIGNLHTINQDTSLRIPYTFWRLKANDVSTSYDVQLTHHYIAPEDDLPDSIPFRLSTKHFWTVQTGAVNGPLEGNIEYFGLRDNDLDHELVRNTEDSLILVYRRNGNEPWLEYPYYEKVKLLPTDRKGHLELDKVLPGQYALANGPSGIFVPSRDAEFITSTIFPNPSQDYIQVQLDHDWKTKDALIQIIDAKGGILFSQQANGLQGQTIRIDISHLPKGVYLFKMIDQKGTIARNRFVKA